MIIQNLSKVFQGPRGQGITALSDLTLTIEDRELMVLVGPSGCGKTTTLRLIAGLEEVTAGQIIIDGQVMNDVPPQDRDIAMVFQNSALYPHMSVYENMAFGLKLRKLPKPEIEARVREAADTLGLSALLARKPTALSGGERRRVALGRAIVRKPKVFLFDEPLSNLDPQSRLQMRAEISKLHQRLGPTMIYVTHDQHEAMTMGSRLAVMKQGMLQQVGAPLETYERPANLFVADFIGSMNFFHGTIIQKGDQLLFVSANDVNSTMLSVAPEHTRSLQPWIGKKVILGLRPEDIHRGASTSQMINAQVQQVERPGPETLVHFRNGTESFIARFPAAAKLQPSETVPLQFDMLRAHYFDATTETRCIKFP